MKLSHTKIDYITEQQEVIVRLYGRDGGGQRHVVGMLGTEPWFCVEEDPAPVIARSQHQFAVKRIEKWGRSLDGKPLWRIVASAPYYVGERTATSLARLFPKHYEADVPYNRRIMVETGIRSGVEIDENFSPQTRVVRGKSLVCYAKEAFKPTDFIHPPRVGIIDIENDDSKGLPTSKNPNVQVYTVSVHDSYTDRYVSMVLGGIEREKFVEKMKSVDFSKPVDIIQCVDESELFRTASRTIDEFDFDIITGWNVEYDTDYITERAKRMGYRYPDFVHRVVFDMQDGNYHLHQTKAYASLQETAFEVLGYGKIPRRSTHDMFADDRAGLLVYNIWDVELVRRIDERRGILKFFLGIARTAGCPLETAFYNSKVVDMLILHHLHGSGIVLPSFKFSDKVAGVEGGLVKTPHKGLEENVVMVDISSAYPSIMISFNMSPETKLPKTAVRGVKGRLRGINCDYRADVEGIMPRLLRELLERRGAIQRARDKLLPKSPEWESLEDQQKVFRFLNNSFYGVLASNVYRLADRDIASDITGIARELLRSVDRKLTSCGCQVLYGDTDSILFKLPVGLDVDSAVREVRDGFDEFAAQWGVDRHLFDIKVECIYQKWFQADRKKRYAGLVSHSLRGNRLVETNDWPMEKRLRIVGFERRRFDWPDLTKRSQVEGFKLLFLEGVPSLLRYLRLLVRGVRVGKYTDELLIPSTYNRPPENYTHPPAPIRAAVYGTTYLSQRIQLGDDFKWVYVRTVRGAPQTDVVGLAWDASLPPEVLIDFDVMAGRCLRGPWESVLDALGVSWDEVETGQRQEVLF